MPKDIRKMLENYPEESANLSSNHSNRFERRLMKELHQEKPKRQTIKWLSIAASLALIVTVAIQFIPRNIEPNPVNNIPGIETNKEQKISLGTISPELNTIETYYTNSINLELSQLDITEENQEILNRYLNKIKS